MCFIPPPFPYHHHHSFLDLQNLVKTKVRKVPHQSPNGSLARLRSEAGTTACLTLMRKVDVVKVFCLNSQIRGHTGSREGVQLTRGYTKCQHRTLHASSRLFETWLSVRLSRQGGRSWGLRFYLSDSSRCLTQVQAENQVFSFTGFAKICLTF